MSNLWHHPKIAIEADGQGQRASTTHAFSLLELMIVLGIIGLLAALGVPALKGLSQSNTLSAAARQLQDDLALARQRAIVERTTVYVVFVPPDFFQPANTFNYQLGQMNLAQRKLLTNLVTGQYTSYALLAKRGVGDQPGRSRPRYITEWKHLPEGVFIATNKFVRLPWRDWSRVVNMTNRPFAYYEDPVTGSTVKGFRFPFPTSQSQGYFSLPYIAFNPQGQLIREGTSTLYPDEIIPLARGSIFYPQSGATFAPADVVEVPAGNSVNTFHRVRINWMTGRTRVERPQIQ
jgi:prepilin-type N-terminal cleavage/methylation domain-containing protein